MPHYDKDAYTIAGKRGVYSSDTMEGYLYDSDNVYGQAFSPRIPVSWDEEGLCLSNFWHSLDPNDVWGKLNPDQRESIMGEQSVLCQWEMMHAFHFQNTMRRLLAVLAITILFWMLIGGTVFA